MIHRTIFIFLMLFIFFILEKLMFSSEPCLSIIDKSVSLPLIDVKSLISIEPKGELFFLLTLDQIILELALFNVSSILFSAGRVQTFFSSGVSAIVGCTVSILILSFLFSLSSINFSFSVFSFFFSIVSILDSLIIFLDSATSFLFTVGLLNNLEF